MTQKNEVAVQKDITDLVSARIDEMTAEGLKIPEHYSYQNALKSAFFAIQNVTTAKQDGNQPALLACTKKSIANSLLDMVIQGLTPAKTQCYFLVYKNYKTNEYELQMQRSYFGAQATVKRLENVKDIWAEVIHQDDVFEISSQDAHIVVTKFEPKFENMDKPIIGAFAVVKKSDDENVYTVMTKKQIDQSWSKAKTTKVQNEFPEEMAKRTVINRAAKNFINTSDDSDLYIESINRSVSNEYDDTEPEAPKDVTPKNKAIAAAVAETTETPKTKESVVKPDSKPKSADEIKEPEANDGSISECQPEPEPQVIAADNATEQEQLFSNEAPF